MSVEFFSLKGKRAFSAYVMKKTTNFYAESTSLEFVFHLRLTTVRFILCLVTSLFCIEQKEITSSYPPQKVTLLECFETID